jgi:hypothetical protein
VGGDLVCGLVVGESLKAAAEAPTGQHEIDRGLQSALLGGYGKSNNRLPIERRKLSLALIGSIEATAFSWLIWSSLKLSGGIYSAHTMNAVTSMISASVAPAAAALR